MKSLPLAYNKDMQEDKENLFDAIDTVKGCLLLYTPMLKTMRVKKEKMYQATKGGYTNATDVADYLAKKGVPFRQAHEIVGKTVLYCIEQGKNLDDLTIDEYKSFSDIFGEDIYQAISIEECVNARNIPGGPAPQEVQRVIEKGKALVEQNKKWL